VRALSGGREEHDRPPQEAGVELAAPAGPAAVSADGRVAAVSPFADAVGYSRAVRVGEHVHVAGTAPIMPGAEEPPADAYGQARRCLEIVVAALADLGASPDDVVRTRIYLTRAGDIDGAGRAHGEVFATARPATTAVVIDSLLDPRWLVEIEAEAIVS
jgi:enamine deaminase RidA (YjgF/YER057c/UK114 family)